jgi:cell division protein FtsQ
VRRARLIAFALVAAAAGSSPFWGPPALRHVPWFAADRVEVAGARLLAPHEVVQASGVRIGMNVWADPAAWEAALRRHPVIASAEVERKLPSTLRIRIVEKRPVAFLSGTLRPATAAGEILPVDPARVPVDLPIAGTAPDGASRVRDRATLRVLAEAARLSDADPMLMARVSEVGIRRDGATRLVMAAPRAEVLLASGAAEPRLTQLRAALADVDRRLPGGGRAVLDARFADQVVVRLLAPTPAPVPAPQPSSQN